MPKAELKTVTVYEETKQRLKQRGEMDDSYNDVITRLIDNTAAPVGAIKTDANIHADEFKPATDTDESCVYFDTIAGETCGNDAEWKQRAYYGEDDDGEVLYYCDDHGPHD